LLDRNKLTLEDKIALQNEIDILTQVDHPNIVKLYEIFEDDEAYYLVMELMLGGEVRLIRLYIIYKTYSYLTKSWRKNSTVRKRPQRLLDQLLTLLNTVTR
jgi:serine/threonine protein kinase